MRLFLCLKWAVHFIMRCTAHKFNLNMTFRLNRTALPKRTFFFQKLNTVQRRVLAVRGIFCCIISGIYLASNWRCVAYKILSVRFRHFYSIFYTSTFTNIWPGLWFSNASIDSTQFTFSEFHISYVYLSSINNKSQ